MKKIFPLILMLTLVITLSTAFLSRSTETPDTTQMVADWERAKAYTQEYLDAATEEAFSFKPTADMRTFGEQMLHLAEANYGLTAVATGKTPPFTIGQLEKGTLKTKTEISKAVLDSYDYVIAAIKTLTPEQAAARVKLFDKFEMTGQNAIEKAFEHQTHHRGQTTVYLRLKGIKPPQEKLL